MAVDAGVAELVGGRGRLDLGSGRVRVRRPAGSDAYRRPERGERTALLTPLVVFQSYFVLTSYYQVPSPEAAKKLRALLAFRGLTTPERPILRSCLDTLAERSVDLVDAYLAALCASRQLNGVYSFDNDLKKLGITLLAVD